MEIKFGTDGWRGIIADDFTVEKVRIVTQGVSNYLKKTNDSRPPEVLIGYDTRFNSAMFAEEAAKIFALNSIKAVKSDRFIPTPVLSTAVVKRKADLGIMITASHNPPRYNGYKIKESFGGSATMDTIRNIEKEVNEVLNNKDKYNEAIYGTGTAGRIVEEDDFTIEYIKHISGIVDPFPLKGFDFNLLFDPMYGASQDIFRDVLNIYEPKNLQTIHAELNPAFGGINPEPIGDNLKEAVELVIKGKKDMAVCLDGDGDRIAALGSGGNYISSHHIFAIVLWDLASNRGLKGRVVKTVTTSSIVDRICKKFGLELEITPVGFKYIGEKIVEGNVLMGGEESGGLWVYGNIPERDGMLMGLRLIEIMCQQKKAINDILKNLYREFGDFAYSRKDYEAGIRQREKLKSKLSEGIPEILKAEGFRDAITIDGYKYIIDDYNWVMLRPSGTEAVVRIYAEGKDRDKSDYLQKIGKKILDSFI